MEVRTPLPSSAARPPAATGAALRAKGALPPTQNPIPNAPVWPTVTGPTWALWDETTVIPAIVTAIDNAKTVVNAEYFQITDTGKGQLVTDALARAAKRGVEVNVIADFMSLVTPPPFSYSRFKKLVTEAGGTVITTSRIPFSPRAKESPALKHVDHRKVLTIDGDIAFTGGMNLAKMTDGYHDSMLQLAGVDAARLGVNQLNRWASVGGTVTDKHRQIVDAAIGDAPLEPSKRTDMRLVTNAPEQQQFGLSNAYLDAIRGAKQRLWISSPAYTSQALISEIDAAARRGVDVRFVMPGKAPAGLPLINWVTASHLAELTKLGATAYAIPEVLHRKALVADDMAILGSFNITDRSAVHDHEIGIQSADPAFVDAISNVLTSDMARGTELEPGSRKGVGKWIGDLLAQTFHLSY